jgi:hypothetical protein
MTLIPHVDPAPSLSGALVRNGDACSRPAV